MLERRTLLAGLAALPAAGLPIAAPAVADPFTHYGADILALCAAVDAGCPEDEATCLMDRWAEIDRLALAERPTTLAGALGALQMARREFVQFQIDGCDDGDDASKRLVLHLVDSAIAVLRQAAGGGVA